MSIIRVILFLFVGVILDKCKSQLFGSFGKETTSCAALARTRFYFFYGPEYSDNQIYGHNELSQLIRHENYDQNRMTILYIHGYRESAEADSIQWIVAAYNSRNDHNLIVLDWSEGASGDYFKQAVPNCVALGATFGQILVTAFQNGLNINKFHLVGHSLGGQMSGYIGRTIISRSNNAMKLPRITGLDPANPAFFPSFFYQPLTYRDAGFVDILHTDANAYGQPYSTGTVDFWPNGGSKQPGCPAPNFIPFILNDKCSHQRSVEFYAESVASTDPTTFLATSAQSWSRFQAGATNQNQVANMGLNCPTNIDGDYYLQTNSIGPFSRGPNGMRYLN